MLAIIDPESESLSKKFIPNPSPFTKATELVPILLRAGSNVNAQRTNDGFSALHVAAMVGRLEVANLLLQVFFIVDC